MKKPRIDLVIIYTLAPYTYGDPYTYGVQFLGRDYATFPRKLRNGPSLDRLFCVLNSGNWNLSVYPVIDGGMGLRAERIITDEP